MPITKHQLNTILARGLFPLVLASALAACNLQTQPETPNLGPLATNTVLAPVTNPPAQQATSGPPTLPPPPLSTFASPTPLQLTTTVSPGVLPLPTVNAAQAKQRYELQASAGKTVGVNYAIVVTLGSVTVTLQGAEGVLWQKTFTTSETGRTEVVIPQGGTYEILATSDRLEGSYDLSWD